MRPGLHVSPYLAPSNCWMLSRILIVRRIVVPGEDLDEPGNRYLSASRCSTTVVRPSQLLPSPACCSISSSSQPAPTRRVAASRSQNRELQFLKPWDPTGVDERHEFAQLVIGRRWIMLVAPAAVIPTPSSRIKVSSAAPENALRRFHVTPELGGRYGTAPRTSVL
ncbi:hypothetical protein P154DRAFT_562447 [Amniculicola lignicola CBS 123094]|uniref:Uncharacterized protein n=1 Tax=Amniculicola lignicola CBS 123094 TaxID=1392246 RepID=A0A6A5WIQ5_9PLEO|nr:hypothetical protein P154DRAFT_562447 [Amniculicola lignicola CBS 123094]